MQLSNDQIVSILMAKYKKDGVDMSRIVADPVFRSLPLNSQIEALKDNANDIHSSIKPGLNNSDIKSMAVDAGFAGVASTLGAGAIIAKSGLVNGETLSSVPSLIAHSKAMRNVTIFAGLSGLAIGGLASLLNKRSEINRRKNAAAVTESLSLNPTSERAVVALSKLQTFTGSGVDTQIANRASSMMLDKYNKGSENILPNLYQDRFLTHLNSK